MVVSVRIGFDEMEDVGVLKVGSLELRPLLELMVYSVYFTGIGVFN